MPESLEELDALIAALNKPLTAEDESDGWTETARSHWLAYASGLREGICVTTDHEHSDAPHHFVRWLDHEGIGVKDGRLAELAAKAQASLDRFA